MSINQPNAAADSETMTSLLAKLDSSTSKFNLIHTLTSLSVENLNTLNVMIKKWNVDLAKIVLDEIESRTVLLAELEARVLNNNTHEVKMLQPLFHRGLWIFGPEYETIEYTSNEGMTRVIQHLFGARHINGSARRPDFAILPDGSVGLYSLPKYDDSFAEVGVDRLTVVELKKPGTTINREQKGQAWGYVKELFSKGLLRDCSAVTCFVLGSELDPLESGKSIEMDGRVTIIPLAYDTVIRRAKSRLLNLHDKIKHASFIKDARQKAYIEDNVEMAVVR
jgi:hypothetical protein